MRKTAYRPNTVEYLAEIKQRLTLALELVEGERTPASPLQASEISTNVGLAAGAAAVTINYYDKPALSDAVLVDLKRARKLADSFDFARDARRETAQDRSNQSTFEIWQKTGLAIDYDVTRTELLGLLVSILERI